jgi:hypothetical protein
MRSTSSRADAGSSAITTTLARCETTPCPSANFWIVVNTTPPAAPAHV